MLGPILLLCSLSVNALEPKASKAAKVSAATKEVAKPTDPCQAFKTKFCADKKTPFETSKCLVEKRKDLSKECKDLVMEQVSKSHACATAILMFCPKATDLSLPPSIECLYKFQSSLSEGCQEELAKRVINMKKTLSEFETACGAENEKHCPNLPPTDRPTCMEKAYQQNKIQGDCKVVMDKYAAMRKKRPAPKGK